jgi:hypothetical protein
METEDEDLSDDDDDEEEGIENVLATIILEH